MTTSASPLVVLRDEDVIAVQEPEAAAETDVSTPILHTFETLDRHYVLNPTRGRIFQLPSRRLAAMTALPPETTTEQMQALEDFQDLTAGECRELLDLYRGLLEDELATEEAPILANEFDDPDYLERFQAGIMHFSFIPTHQCNLRCSYCVFTGSYEGRRSHEGVDVPDEVVDRAADFIASLGADAPKVDLRLYGGESLIRWRSIRRFYERLRPAVPASKLLFFKITTNGLLLSPEIADYCVENDLLMQVSLDGPAEIHDRERVSAGGQPTFDRIFANVERLYDRAPEYFSGNFFINSVYGPPYAVDEADAWFLKQEMFASMGHRERTFSVAHVNDTDTRWFADRGDYRTEWAKTLERQRERYVDGLARNEYPSIRFFPAALFEGSLSQLAARLAWDRKLPERDTRWARPDCIPGEQVAIDPRGDLYICIQTTDFVSIGNIWDGFDPQAMRRLRQAFLEKKNRGCRRCWAYRYCDMCLAKMNKGKVLNQVTYNQNCAKTRRKLSSALKLYQEVLEKAPGALEQIFGASPN